MTRSLQTDEHLVDRVHISLLGPLTVTRGDGPVEVAGPKRRALLIYLALRIGSPVGRDRIVEALWPQSRTGREESTLRVHVSRLRSDLEPDRGDAPTVLLTRGSSYVLSSEAVDLDIARFDRLAAQGRDLLEDDPEAALERLDEALRLWRGRPLEEVEYEEFAQEEIRRLERSRDQAILDRATALIEIGREHLAVEDLESMVRTEPDRQRPVRLLMTAHHRLGRQGDALRAARRHRRHLASRGLEASPEIAVLEERILRHDPSLLPPGRLSPGEVRPGRSIRGYELREEIGSGSTGVVYRAFQPSVGREVAVKAVREDLSSTPEFVLRFAEEARLIARLEHPHIVPLYDFWREPTGAFLVMRWLEGGNLASRLGHEWGEAALRRLFEQLADALGYAHSAGVVHDRLIPENVLFDSAGNAYVADFAPSVSRPPRIAHGRRPMRPRRTPAVRNETPTVSSDVFAIGTLLDRVVGPGHTDAGSGSAARLQEVVAVATAADPADRYPDMDAFRTALREAFGQTTAPAPLRTRRNPYKGLEPFDEGDRADFYGRDEVVETLLDMVGREGLVSVIGASGSGKSSVVKAGLVPGLRDGALPGSDEWAVVHMVPGTDPFEEFHLGLRDAAVSHPAAAPAEGFGELRAAFDAALDGPSRAAVLVVDQFEEVFSSAVDPAVRERFLDDVVDLATDPARRVRVVLTLRADFSDRPLAHPRLGDLMARTSLLLGPLRPDQIEEAIRAPAARVGVRVEPGLVSEIVRDVGTAPSALPHLQYVLSELFERRVEDRLTVRGYRALGGVQGVLERRAEATYAALDEEARRVCRQVFLRLVHLSPLGDATRRRLALAELHGVGRSAATDEVLDAFSAVRLLVYDRDPVSRTPTVELAHETVITRWTRLRVWIEDARADLIAHRRLSEAAASWSESGEDPAYLLGGGPLARGLDLRDGERVELNELEARFVAESSHREMAARQAEEERRARESTLRQQARRRLLAGVTGVLAALVIGFLAVRAGDLAGTLERENLARELAAASVAKLDSGDPDLSLLLAVAAADQSIDAGEPVLDEVVDALHLALVNPRPSVLLDGAGIPERGQGIAWFPSGDRLVTLWHDGGVAVVDGRTGAVLARLPAVEPPAIGVAAHPDGIHVITVHSDGGRLWDPATRSVIRHVSPGDGAVVTTAVPSPEGSLVAIGTVGGPVVLADPATGAAVRTLRGHDRTVMGLDFDPAGERLVTVGLDRLAIVWDVATGAELVNLDLHREGSTVDPLGVAWRPDASEFIVVASSGDVAAYDAVTGEPRRSFGNGQHHPAALDVGPTGSLLAVAGDDGSSRLYGAAVGGEEIVALPTGGVPLRDVAVNPAVPGGRFEVATLGVNGQLGIWPDVFRAETTILQFQLTYPTVGTAAGADRYFVNGHTPWLGLESEGAYRVFAGDGTEIFRHQTLTGDGDWILRGAAISADGAVGAFTGPDGDIHVADLDAGAVTVLPDSAAWTASLALSSDGRLLVGGGVEGSVAAWDTETGDKVLDAAGHGDRAPRFPGVPRRLPPDVADREPYSAYRVHDVEVHPAGQELASAGYDGTVRVWDPSSGAGRVVHEFDHETSSIAYSPDGSSLAAFDTTGRGVILDTETSRIVDELEPVSGRTAIAFSPDGRLIGGAGPGRFAYVWDASTGALERRLVGFIYRPTTVGFSHGGTRLLAMDGVGILRAYHLDPLELVEVARSETRRELTDAECREYLGRPCEG